MPPKYNAKSPSAAERAEFQEGQDKQAEHLATRQAAREHKEAYLALIKASPEQHPIRTEFAQPPPLPKIFSEFLDAFYLRHILTSAEVEHFENHLGVFGSSSKKYSEHAELFAKLVASSEADDEEWQKCKSDALGKFGESHLTLFLNQLALLKDETAWGPANEAPAEPTAEEEEKQKRMQAREGEQEKARQKKQNEDYEKSQQQKADGYCRIA